MDRVQSGARDEASALRPHTASALWPGAAAAPWGQGPDHAAAALLWSRRPFCGRGGISPAGSGLAAPAPWPPVPCLVPRARAAHLAPRSPSEETAAADGDPAVDLTTTARRHGKNRASGKHGVDLDLSAGRARCQVTREVRLFTLIIL